MPSSSLTRSRTSPTSRALGSGPPLRFSMSMRCIVRPVVSLVRIPPPLVAAPPSGASEVEVVLMDRDLTDQGLAGRAYTAAPATSNRGSTSFA
jgi:hypothetical protein